NAVKSKRGGHPQNIIFLTCDASCVIPPIERLTVEQAIYNFISGYTSKIAGTEIGLREEPEITFSACFGGPFMVHRPTFYANLLRRKIERYSVKCWLVNTGWVGGPYGVGKRISIKHTRNLLNAVLSGALDTVEYYTDPVFGFLVPKSCPEVPEDVMYPERAWPKKEEYWKRYRQLASRFIDNMKKFDADTPKEVVEAGPKI
ncbi:MAG: phosphoenolpyruvate carboxykinase (ATP), partial [Chloroflexota bacterium]